MGKCVWNWGIYVYVVYGFKNNYKAVVYVINYSFKCERKRNEKTF